MQLPTSEDLDSTGFSRIQRLLVECLHQMSHLESLDSFRAKCLNLRTSTLELSHELIAGRANDNETKSLCLECAKFCARDPIFKSVYAHKHARIEGLLKAPPAAPKKGDKDEHAKQRLVENFMHEVSDFSVSLNNSYFSELCKSLPLAVISNDEGQVFRLIGAILSDLFYQGWSYASVFSWAKRFTSGGTTEFSSNIELMLSVIQRPPQSYKATLQLSGSTKLAAAGDLFGFKFVDNPGAPSGSSKSVAAFFKHRPLRIFAQCEMEATDYQSAAFQAYGRLESVLDTIRLEYENGPIVVNDVIHVQNDSSKKTDNHRLMEKGTRLPNPIDAMSHKEFHRFVHQFDAASKRMGFDHLTIEQLRAAIRLYRVGRDTLRVQDKCLYWWMGLETLLYTGSGSIGSTVATNASRILVSGYLFRLIRDLIATLRYYKIDWGSDLESLTGCSSIDHLSVEAIIKLLQDTSGRSLLWSKTDEHPIIEHHYEQLGKSLENAAATLDLLTNHLENIEWQLARLYRIRCCIVHGSSTPLTLHPFAANLEYYLKQTITFMIKSFVHYHHVNSRTELFARAYSQFDRKIEDLKAASDNSIIPRIVLEDIVVGGSIHGRSY